MEPTKKKLRNYEEKFKNSESILKREGLLLQKTASSKERMSLFRFVGGRDSPTDRKNRCQQQKVKTPVSHQSHQLTVKLNQVKVGTLGTWENIGKVPAPCTH